MIDRYLTDDLSSRRVIDVAIGILMALRRCTEKEAFDDLADAVRQTGVGLGAIAGALVDLVGGSGEKSRYRDEALDVWGQLLAGRRSYSGVTAE